MSGQRPNSPWRHPLKAAPPHGLAVVQIAADVRRVEEGNLGIIRQRQRRIAARRRQRGFRRVVSDQGNRIRGGQIGYDIMASTGVAQQEEVRVAGATAGKRVGAVAGNECVRPTAAHDGGVRPSNG